MGATVLDWPAEATSRGIVITAGASKAPTSISGISLLTGGNGVGTALLIDYSGNIAGANVQPRTSPRLRANNIHMAGSGTVTNTGWLHHLDAVNVLGAHIVGCAVEGRGSGGVVVSQTGYRFRGNGAPVEFTVQGCWAYQVADALSSENAEGLVVTGCNFVAVNRGVFFTGSTVEPQCHVSDSHINAFVACVDLDWCGQANIHDNLLFSRDELTTDVVGVRMSVNCKNGRVTRNTFVRTGTCFMSGVQVAGPDVTVDDNLFQSVELGVDILASALRTVVRGGRHIGAVTTRIANASSSTVIEALTQQYASSLNDLPSVTLHGTIEAAIAPGATDRPTGTGTSGSFIRTQSFDGNTAHQEFRDSVTGDMFIRSKISGAFTVWRRVTAMPMNGPRDMPPGTGSPEGVLAAPVGSTFRRTDGGAGTSFYVKETGGAANTGWVAK